MSNYWGVIFERSGGRGPTLADLPCGTFGYWHPTYRRWYIMWPTP